MKFNNKHIAIAAAALLIVAGIAFTSKNNATPPVGPAIGDPMIGGGGPVENTSINLETLATDLKSIEIQNHNATSTFESVTDANTLAIIVDELTKATPYELTNTEHEALASAQSDGHSFALRFNLNDGESAIIRVVTNLDFAYFNDSHQKVSKTISKLALDAVEGLGDLASINSPAVY